MADQSVNNLFPASSNPQTPVNPVQPMVICGGQLTLRALLKQLRAPLIIGITGDSGSGKTTYSNGIRRLLGSDIVSTIDMDGYHKEDRKKRQETGHLPLDPTCNNLELLCQHLKQLKQGISVEIPIYNHLTGTFDPPKVFPPTPIIIIEGLHALYPEFLPYLDFSIFVDPERDIKWRWKYERDMKKRGHKAETLLEEMLKRESAYKRWIDFQKTNAQVVIKVFQSKVRQFARYELIGGIPEYYFKVELIIEPAKVPLPSIPLPFDLAAVLDVNQHPFMFAAIPSSYWGRACMVIHIDGVFQQKFLGALENHIAEFTGIPVDQAMEYKFSPSLQNYEVSATQLAQLLLTWRFLEQVNHKLIVLKEEGKISC